MRQSDVGIAYEESDEDDGDDDEEEGTENGTNGVDNDDDDDDEDYEDIEEDDDDVKGILDDGAKDPRAGKVDVVLPQLQPDFEKLSGALFEAGSGKQVAKLNCERLYRLSKQLKDLAAGAYPLAAELDKHEIEAPKRISVAKAAKKAAEEEIEMILKAREERKLFKEAIKEKQKALTAAPKPTQEVKMIDNGDGGSEEEAEEFELEPEVDVDVETPEHAKSKKLKKKLAADEEEDEVEAKPEKKKKRKKEA